MQAYAIFDGGGVKGAALAGCLKAARDSGIEFVGYGGTSAGSIVALLAAVGYSGDEIGDIMVNALQLGKLLADVSQPINELKEIKAKLADLGFWGCVGLKGYKPLMKSLATDLGFTDGRALSAEILKLARRKLGGDLAEHFTFHDLQTRNCPPLKIVASDLGARLPVIFSNVGGDEQNGPVLDAIRASMSYPFVFRPVRVNTRLLVDGGLCSNLPVFLFDREREQDRLPLLAFDLVVRPAENRTQYDIGHFCSDMLDTALEAGDFLMRRATGDIYHVRINVPEGIGTLDFDLASDRLQQLFDKGVADTMIFLNKELVQWQQAENQIERLQALYAPPEDIEFVLQQFAIALERETEMTSVRTQVMLPTGRGRRIVAYQHNMDNDPDQDLELAEDGGCSGRCWTSREPTFADLEDAAVGDNYLKWKMTPQQQAKVRKDRKTMLSIPIFDRMSLGERDLDRQRLVGVLSADSDASLRDMMWLDGELLSDAGRRAITVGLQWSGMLTRVLR